MNHKHLHPLTSSGLKNLAALSLDYGCDLRNLPWLAYLGCASALRQPLAWLESAIHGRAVARQQIEPAPVFIVGHWRSGTTYLQNLMSEDRQFARVTLTQAAMPREFLTAARWFSALEGMLPGTRLMDNVAVSADAPWEEEMALTSFGRLSFYHVSFFPKAMDRIFREAVLFNDGESDLIASWQRQYLHFLKKVQLVQPGQPLLLKNPANTARISILRKMFPGARFVHIHRDPYKVFASTVHLYMRTQQAWGLHKVDRERIVRHVLMIYPALMNAFFDQSRELAGSELVEVKFRDLQGDPIGTLRSIYEGIGLDGFDEATSVFRRHIDGQRGYRKNRLTLGRHEHALVAAQWGEIFARLGYPV